MSTGKLVRALSDNLIVGSAYDDMSMWLTSGAFTVGSGQIIASGVARLVQPIAIADDEAYEGFLFQGTITGNHEGTPDILGQIAIVLLYNDGTTEGYYTLVSGARAGQVITAQERLTPNISEDRYPTMVIAMIETFYACTIGELSIRYDYGMQPALSGDQVPPNLLRNSSFEIAEEGEIKYWDGDGVSDLLPGTLPPVNSTTGRKILHLFQNGWLKTEPTAFIDIEVRPIIISFYSASGMGTLDIIAPSGTAIKSYTWGPGSIRKWKRHTIVVNPIEFGLLDRIGLHFHTEDYFGTYVEAVKVEYGEDEQTAPTAWVPHVDDQADLVSWLQTLRLGWYNWLNNHAPAISNPFIKYTWQQLVKETTAIVPNDGLDHLFNNLRFELREDVAEYNVFYHEYNPETGDLLGPFDTSRIAVQNYPHVIGQALLLVISPEPKETFNPIHHIHQVYTLVFGEPEGAPTNQVFRVFKVGGNDYSYLDTEAAKKGLLDFADGKTSGINISNVVELYESADGLEAMLSPEHSDLNLSYFVSREGTSNIIPYTGTVTGLILPGSTVGVVAHRGELTSNSIVSAIGAQFVQGTSGGGGGGGAGGAIMQTARATFSNGMTFDFTEAYDEVISAVVTADSGIVTYELIKDLEDRFVGIKVNSAPDSTVTGSVNVQVVVRQWPTEQALPML